MVKIISVITGTEVKYAAVDVLDLCFAALRDKLLKALSERDLEDYEFWIEIGARKQRGQKANSVLTMLDKVTGDSTYEYNTAKQKLCQLVWDIKVTCEVIFMPQSKMRRGIPDG